MATLCLGTLEAHAGEKPATAGGGKTHVAWQDLARRGNPIIALLDQAFSQPLDERERQRLLALPPGPPQPNRVAKRYYAYAGRLMNVAYAVADRRSAHRDRGDLMTLAVDLMDRNLEGLDEEGFWARRGIGDPNTNRFVLMRVLEAARLLKQTEEGRQRWPGWREMLGKPIEQQRRAYAGDKALLEWDYGARQRGSYVNVDLAFMIIMALSSELLGRPEDRDAASQMMKHVAENLLPDGGFRYHSKRNESARYHTAAMCFLGRYLTLTGDPLARQTLEKTVEYYPLSLTAEAVPELWSAPWWKQHFARQYGDPQHPTGLIVASGITGDPRNHWLMWQALQRTEPVLPEDAISWLYAADYWPDSDGEGQALSEEYWLPDRNILGFRGRRQNWYYGLTQRRGLRNTFVGAVLTRPQAEPALAAAVRGIQVHVQPDGGPELWLSGPNDPVAATHDRKAAAVVGASCGLQPSRYGDSAGKELPSSPWRTTQVSYVGADGLLAMVRLRATFDTRAKSTIGRVLLGPAKPEQVSERAFVCGPLQIVVLDASTAPFVGHWGAGDQSDWPCLEFAQTLDREVKAGEDLLHFTVWLAPKGESPPLSFERLTETAWRAVWNGREVVAAFNPDAAARRIGLPENFLARHTQGWFGEEAKPVKIAPDGTVLISSGACLIMEAQ